MRKLSLLAVPEVDIVPDDAAALSARTQRRRQAAATEAAALRRARAERAARKEQARVHFPFLTPPLAHPGHQAADSTLSEG